MSLNILGPGKGAKLVGELLTIFYLFEHILRNVTFNSDLFLTCLLF